MYAVLILMVPRLLNCCEFTMLAMPRAMECIVIEIASSFLFTAGAFTVFTENLSILQLFLASLMIIISNVSLMLCSLKCALDSLQAPKNGDISFRLENIED